MFATRGYSSTGVRDVAELAGVNSALVTRYFGSKDGLFRAALESTLDISSMLKTDRGTFGRHVVQVFFDSQDVPNPFTMMILAASETVPRAISVELMQSRVAVPLAAWIGGADAYDRAVRLNILWTGFFTMWKLLPLDALSGEGAASARCWLEEATQALLDQGAGVVRAAGTPAPVIASIAE